MWRRGGRPIEVESDREGGYGSRDIYRAQFKDGMFVELTMFAAGVWMYVTAGSPGRRRAAFWLMIAFLLVVYFAVAFGPPPPDVRTLALSALALWLLVPWARWADRRLPTAD